MPKLKSAKKRLRQSERRATVNYLKKEAYKSVKRQIKKALATGQDKNKLVELGKNFYKAVDKAAKTGVIHLNKASREKARIMELIGATTSTKTETKKPAKKTAKAPRKTAKAKSAKGGRKKVSVRKAK